MAIAGEFDYLCRLCATKTGMMMGLPIFEAGDRMRNIDKKIAACLPIQVSLSDQLPKVVCLECALKLNEMFDFREKCLDTEGMFIKMLKQLKGGNGHVERTVKVVEELPAIQNSIDRIHCNITAIRTDIINNLENGKCGLRVENDETTIHTMHVMDEMDLAGGEQVVGQEEIGSQETDTKVIGIDCLDCDTVRMVNEHIREVSNHEMAMHLEGDMGVVENLTVEDDLSQLGINYVTTMSADSQTQEQIVHYGENDKFENVTLKDEFQQLPDHLTPENSSRSEKNDVSIISDWVLDENSTYVTLHNGPFTIKVANNNFSSSHPEPQSELENSVIGESDTNPTMSLLHSESLASTNQINSKDSDIIIEYTEQAKQSLLENTLTNLNFDETGSSWYLCPFCDEACPDSTSLTAHFDQHFCCCTCGLYFTSVEMLNLHEEQCVLVKTTETTTKNQSVQLNEEAKKQPNSRQKSTPKVCSYCGKQYRTNYKLQEHMRKHTGEKPFQCSQCEKAFRSKIGLAQHTATHTGEFDYNCSTCGKGFQCKSYLIVHQRVHSDLKPFPCNTCGQNFKTKQSLLDHENRHRGVKPYTCEICGRGFITKGLCKSHQKIHSGKDNRQYPCKVCNKMFVSKSYLNTHLRIHTGEKPYLCEVCGKGFLTRVDLKIHSTMHTGEKSFKCEMCGKVFARRVALRCHGRSHTGERPYSCDVCGKTFTQFSPMAIHKRLHTGERPYECDVCGKTFVSRSPMMCHRKKHHPNFTETSSDPLAIIEETDEQEFLEIAIRAASDGISITAD